VIFRKLYALAALALVCASMLLVRPTTAAECVTASAAQGWQNTAFTTQTDSFTAEFDATPSRTGYEALVGLSDGAKTSDSGFAAAVRFNTSGRIDARGQGSFTASSAVSYSANTTYRFRLTVDLPNHRYSVYVTPNGGTQQTVAANLPFRSEQSSVGALSSYGAKVASSSGTLAVCGFKLGWSDLPPASPTPAPPTLTRTATPATTTPVTPTPATATPATPTPATPTPIMPMNGPIGFASVNALGQNGTTGGAGGSEVTVTTAAELADYAGRTGPYIIRISGRIQFSDMITVVANKSIIGVGSSAEITGGGLQLGSTTRPGNNVIIRNITFTNASDDSVSVTNGAHHVWIDHCDFSNGFDGLLDIKRQSDFVTVSWNHFHHHSKTLLLGHSDGYSADIGHLRVTYHHNFFDGTDQRHPRARFGEPVHVFNNYYRNNSLYGVASTENAGVLVEGNFFENVAYPIYVGYADSGPGRVVERNNIYLNSGAPQTAGTVVEPGTYYRYTLDSPASVPALVQAGAGAGKISP
jgi:pectate lyase